MTTRAFPVQNTPCCVLAGTTSTQPQALWRLLQPLSVEIGLTYSTADQDNIADVCSWMGTVFWLPTPSSAASAERAVEQLWRAQLMEASQQGVITLRLLYGQTQDQCAALRACLKDMSIPTIEAPSSQDSIHGHALSARCKECVDPASERKLFSSLLASRK